VVELKEGWGRGVEVRTSEEALLSQVRLLAAHIEHAAEYALATDFKVGFNRVHHRIYRHHSE